MSKSTQRSGRQIRQDFLDFFEARQHTIVPSASLMPDAPNLLFTNAGMNQFVPIFLGEQTCPYKPGRAADTQKCIRAGGKHNDLEDVGMDTYHHTFFEMLGNWSFGEYFKEEAIVWAWELLTGVWGFPKERLYATVYKPGHGEPGEFDQEAYDCWASVFDKAELDPSVHIVNGDKKDNFWMMGDTGPCGPCSELHIDLSRNGETNGSLVNADNARCIEIWNLVFIQYNANQNGTFEPLTAKHVDTGMGFERVAAVIQSTNNFTDFSKVVSNYDTDVFGPIFTEIEKLSGKKYTASLPQPNPSKQEKIDIAFRVIGDHIRTLSFSIADGIQPGNTDRNYVLRRILRRAVRYGRTLGFKEPFFYKLVDVLTETMGKVFPELVQQKNLVQSTIRSEEEAFNKTLDRGIELFREEVNRLGKTKQLPGDFAFKLYDTYGFPLDLTELMAREAGLSVDNRKFDNLMEEQRARARAAQKKEIINVSNLSSDLCTKFIGFDNLTSMARVLEVVREKKQVAIAVDCTPFYAEMGGQVGDTGLVIADDQTFVVTDTQKIGEAFLHSLDGDISIQKGAEIELTVDASHRIAIQRHHTATHLFHWALHEVTSSASSQKGSYVGPAKLTFDFNCHALSTENITDIEQLVNERILENDVVSTSEVSHEEVRDRDDILQFFGDRYSDVVRVVQIGGHRGDLNGYSMELCGGTHAKATGELGLFRIVGESAIAAGVRRVEAVAGLVSARQARIDSERISELAEMLNSPVKSIEQKVEQALDQINKLDKKLKLIQQSRAKDIARGLLAKAQEVDNVQFITANLGDSDANFSQLVADALRSQFNGVLVLGTIGNGNVSLLATVPEDLSSKVKAGDIVQAIAPIIGGKGGGKATSARGGGKDPDKLEDALAEVPKVIIS